jgi:hypothetical protein
MRREAFNVMREARWLLVVTLYALLFTLHGATAAQAAVATDCTLYAAANGVNTNSGTSPTAPKSLWGSGLHQSAGKCDLSFGRDL